VEPEENKNTMYEKGGLAGPPLVAILYAINLIPLHRGRAIAFKIHMKAPFCRSQKIKIHFAKVAKNIHKNQKKT